MPSGSDRREERVCQPTSEHEAAIQPGAAHAEIGEIWQSTQTGQLGGLFRRLVMETDQPHPAAARPRLSATTVASERGVATG